MGEIAEIHLYLFDIAMGNSKQGLRRIVEGRENEKEMVDANRNFREEKKLESSNLDPKYQFHQLQLNDQVYETDNFERQHQQQVENIESDCTEFDYSLDLDEIDQL